jgi:hypothetical protein
MESKFCPICKEDKHVSLFNKSSKAKDKLQHYCRVCSNAKRKEWDLEDPERTRGKWLKDAYGISLETYNEMLEQQNHKCAICNQDETRFHKKLVVDHDHKTGKVRQLLCNMCNHGIGNFKDDVSLMASAIQYIIKHTKEDSNNATDK